MSISLIGADGTNVASPANGVPISLGQANEPAQVGAVRMFSENDSGQATGNASLLSPETSGDYRLRVGTDTLLFNDTFSSTTQNTNVWSYTFSTMTAAQPGAGTVNFGAVQGTTSTHGAFMRTFQYFPLLGTAPLAVEFNIAIANAALVADEIFTCGLGLPTAATATATDGVFLRFTSAGISLVTSFSGVLLETGVITNPLEVNRGYKHLIIVGERYVEYWLNDILQGQLRLDQETAIPGQMCQGTSLPVFMHKYNTGAVSNTNTMRVGDVNVSLQDVTSNKPWAHQQAGMGMSGYVGLNGHTQGKTTIWANNVAPVAVALTNTAAAFTSLGGIAAVLPTLTANNDGIVFGYQNPAPTINIPGRNLYITGVTLNGAVSVVLSGGPVIYAFALAFGHTAASLATVETASFANNTTHSPRIAPLGIHSYPAAAVVGTAGGQLSITLDSPICVRPGEFVQLIARNMGAVTTTGAITLIANINAYWE